ncbi:MAG TPA: trimeric intracellular cation channel family protein [Azospirillaceae bacterium]|nr:trimeric intracellular cation channel family protein [Azospirillaceae bacterium]
MNGYGAALTAIDLAGTFVFGLGGGVIAVRHRLDLFGVLVLAVASALAGGLMRDVLIDAPPAALADTRYLWIALGGGIVAFLAHPLVERVSRPVMLLDALGLGLFAVAGCRKALDAGLSPLPAVILGTLTAVGGGVVRDLLMAEVPRVLREEIYALAALAAAGIVVAGRAAGLDEGAVVTAGIAAGFTLRVLSVRYGWRAPLAPWTRP